MTEVNPMSREELLELAALDALGLLSEYEAALYTRSFHYATATVQDEILALQAMIASDESLLPNEQPPEALRERVLARVAAAIESEWHGHAPLATIGKRRGTPVEAPGTEPVERHRVAGETAHGRMSRQLWRTATFVLCGALVVAVIYHVEMTRRHHDLTTTFIADNTNAQIEQLIGPTFKDFLFDPAGDKILLFLTDETQGNHTVRAAVYVVEGSDRAMLVFEGLEWRDGYELRVRDEEGNIQTVATFASRRKLAGVAFKLPRQTPVVWEVAYAGEVLLAST